MFVKVALHVFILRSFEYGFDSLGIICGSFGVQFFIIMLMFVIFGLGVIISLRGFIVSDYASLFAYSVLLFFVVFGFYIEWSYGRLVWVV